MTTFIGITRSETWQYFPPLSKGKYWRMVQDGELEELEQAIKDKKVSVLDRDKGIGEEHTLLLEAARVDNGDMINMLRQQLADPNAQSYSMKLTPLHYVVAHDSEEGVAQMAKFRSLKVNTKDANGDTPLHLACALGYAGIAKVLLNMGADPNAENYLGQTPVEVGIAAGIKGSKLELISERQMSYEKRMAKRDQDLFIA